MAVVLTVLRVELGLWTATSLKEKRQVVRSVLERTRRRYPVAAAEVDYQEKLNRALLAFAALSSNERVSHRVCQRVAGYVEGLSMEAEVLSIDTETVRL